jgi:hypothetical protein
MTGTVKAASNRTNARSSTGPKTAEGRARSAKNALRHGLSLSVTSDPILSAEIEVLASEIAGKGASQQLQILARRIAEAQIDLRRVRYMRHELLSHALRHPDYGPNASVKAEYDMPLAFSRSTGLVTPVADQRKGTLKRLSALDRYERSARSRRKDTIRAFDLARSEEVR